MREIKFRAWDELNKRFEYIDFSKPETIPIPESVVWNWRKQEFTGLKDKNGKEIYEGDVVHIEDKRRTPIWGTDENKAIVFDGAAFRFDGMNLAEMMGWGGYPAAAITFEIIGNIYENPEFLEKAAA